VHIAPLPIATEKGNETHIDKKNVLAANYSLASPRVCQPGRRAGQRTPHRHTAEVAMNWVDVQHFVPDLAPDDLVSEWGVLPIVRRSAFFISTRAGEVKRNLSQLVHFFSALGQLERTYLLPGECFW
jgi:hypothetical protein